MSLTTQEQELFDFARNALPSWVRDDDAFLRGAAKLFGGVRGLIAYLFEQALIGTAEGATATTPDWLDQHARDRGTGRRDGEDDATLRERLRTTPDALTRAAIKQAVQELIDAAGVIGDVEMIELPLHAAHYGSYQVMTGTGGTFAQSGTVQSFTPDALPWPAPPLKISGLPPSLTFKLTIAGAASGANNGTRDINTVSGDSAQVSNATGVAGGDPTATWTVTRHYSLGGQSDGFARAYYGRGYRYGRTTPRAIIVILPYGSDAALEQSAREALRQMKAAGIRGIVERRLNPP